MDSKWKHGDSVDIIDKHKLYTMHLDCCSLFPYFMSKLARPVTVLHEAFIDVWNSHDSKGQGEIFSMLAGTLEDHASVETCYGLTACVMVEIERTENHVTYSLFGFGLEGNIRTFAKDNFIYYRLKKTQILNMSHVPCWELKLELQELTALTLSGKLEYA